MKHKRQLSDIKKRTIYKNIEVFQKILKFLILYIQNIFISLILQSEFLNIFIFKTVIKNYCIISGRSRSIYKKFKVSRISFREIGSEGLFFGLKKLS